MIDVGIINSRDIIKSAIYGALVGIFFSLSGPIGFIPIIGPYIGTILGISLCFIGPIVMVIAGYLLCVVTNVKKGDYDAAAINFVIYSLFSTGIFITTNFLTRMLVIGVSAIGGTEVFELFVNTGFNLIYIILLLLYQFVLFFGFGLIGVIIYLIFKK